MVETTILMTHTVGIGTTAADEEGEKVRGWDGRISRQTEGGCSVGSNIKPHLPPVFRCEKSTDGQRTFS